MRTGWKRRSDTAQKTYLEIPGGSHFLCIEKNHMSLYRAITAYLAMD